MTAVAVMPSRPGQARGGRRCWDQVTILSHSLLFHDD